MKMPINTNEIFDWAQWLKQSRPGEEALIEKVFRSRNLTADAVHELRRNNPAVALAFDVARRYAWDEDHQTAIAFIILAHHYAKLVNEIHQANEAKRPPLSDLIPDA